MLRYTIRGRERWVGNGNSIIELRKREKERGRDGVVVGDGNIRIER